MKTLKIEITRKIKATLYKGHLPVATGHLDPEDGKTWLGVAVTHGYTKQGHGTQVVKSLCDYADIGGWELWLSCSDELISWYVKFGFKFMYKDKMNYLRRIAQQPITSKGYNK